MALGKDPVARTQMLIRRPASEVFTAFVDPNVTTRFWFTKSSGPLEQGQKIQWNWEMYGVSVPVTVKALDRDSRILIEWGDPPSSVEWKFTPRPDGTTVVSIASWGFTGSEDEIVAKAIDSMGGFSLVLAGLKALLEHDIELNLVGDHHPETQDGADA